ERFWNRRGSNKGTFHRSWTRRGDRRHRCRCWRVELALPALSVALECSPHRLHHCVANRGRIAKTHLAFCRVDIHVDFRRIELEKEKGHRILPLHQRSVIALLQSGSDDSAFDRPAVNENKLLAATRPADSGLSDKTSHSHSRARRRFHLQ